MSVTKTTSDGVMTRRQRLQSSFQQVKSFDEMDQQIRNLVPRRRNPTKVIAVEKDPSPDSDVAPTSPLGPGHSDSEPVTAAQQIWDRMFEGDKFTMPESEYVQGVGKFLTKAQVLKVSAGVVSQLESKKARFIAIKGRNV